MLKPGWVRVVRLPLLLWEVLNGHVPRYPVPGELLQVLGLLSIRFLTDFRIVRRIRGALVNGTLKTREMSTEVSYYHVPGNVLC